MYESILLTKEGLEEFKDEISNLKEKLNKIQTEKSEAYAGAIGDGWHDNFAYEDAKRYEDTVVKQINNLVEQSNYIKLIELESLNSNIVNINDMVELEFIYEDGNRDVGKFKLTGNWKSKDYNDYQEVTLNSPLGKSIYKKGLNCRVEYSVNEKTIVVNILRKIV
jgi:transcription elongation GreA/GreB family factor